MFPSMLMWVSLKLAKPDPHSRVLARMEAWSSNIIITSIIITIIVVIIVVINSSISVSTPWGPFKAPSILLLESPYMFVGLLVTFFTPSNNQTILSDGCGRKSGGLSGEGTKDNVEWPPCRSQGLNFWYLYFAARLNFWKGSARG